MVVSNVIRVAIAHQRRRQAHTKPELVRQIGKLREGDVVAQRLAELEQATVKLGRTIDGARSV